MDSAGSTGFPPVPVLPAFAKAGDWFSPPTSPPPANTLQATPSSRAGASHRTDRSQSSPSPRVASASTWTA